MALCSESKGKSLHLDLDICFIKKLPAETKHSLFAKHNLEQFFIEFKVGFNPAIPTIDATTISTFLLVHSLIPSSPATTFIFLPNKLFFIQYFL